MLKQYEKRLLGTEERGQRASEVLRPDATENGDLTPSFPKSDAFSVLNL